MSAIGLIPLIVAAIAVPPEISSASARIRAIAYCVCGQTTTVTRISPTGSCRLVWNSRRKALDATDRADRQPAAMSEDRVSRLKERISSIKEQMQHLNQTGAQMQAAPDHQVSLTDPDARSTHLQQQNGWTLRQTGFHLHRQERRIHQLRRFCVFTQPRSIPVIWFYARSNLRY